MKATPNLPARARRTLEKDVDPTMQHQNTTKSVPVFGTDRWERKMEEGEEWMGDVEV